MYVEDQSQPQMFIFIVCSIQELYGSFKIYSNLYFCFHWGISKFFQFYMFN